MGGGQYIELMAVNDSAVGHPLPAFLGAHTAKGNRPVAVCVDPGDLDAVAGLLSLEIVHGERRTPSGGTVRWRMAGLDAALGPKRLPFFIDWLGSGPDLDSALNSDTGGFARVVFGGDPGVVEEWLGPDHGLPIDFGAGEPGPLHVGVRRGAEIMMVD